MISLVLNATSDTVTDKTTVSNNRKAPEMKRHKMGRKGSGKLFTRTAKHVHRKNAMRPMRGGIRA